MRKGRKGRTGVNCLNTLLLLIRILNKYYFGLSMKELAEEMNVSVRQIYRYLHMLEEADLGIESFWNHQMGRKKWRLRPKGILKTTFGAAWRKA